MPGARMLRIVVMMLIEPTIEDTPSRWTAKIAMSMPGPIWTDSGGYSVHPEAVAPPGTKNDATSRIAAGGSSQKLKLFRRRNAMSGAPIIIRICQLAKPPNRSEEHTAELQSLTN